MLLNNEHLHPGWDSKPVVSGLCYQASLRRSRRYRWCHLEPERPNTVSCKPCPALLILSVTTSFAGLWVLGTASWNGAPPIRRSWFYAPQNQTPHAPHHATAVILVLSAANLGPWFCCNNVLITTGDAGVCRLTARFDQPSTKLIWSSSRVMRLLWANEVQQLPEIEIGEKWAAKS